MALFVHPDSSVFNYQLNIQCDIFNVRTYSEREEFVASLFKEKLAPYYGDQKDELSKMWNLGSDRKVRVLCKGEEPVGVVVFKTVISEDPYFGKTLKIKNLFILKEENKGKGFEKSLIEYVKKVTEVSLGYLPDLSFTVSDKEPETLKAFKEAGFKVVHELRDFYKVGVTEFFLKLKGTEMPRRNEQPVSTRPAATKIEMPGLSSSTYFETPRQSIKRKWEQEDDARPPRRNEQPVSTRPAATKIEMPGLGSSTYFETPRQSIKRKWEQDDDARPPVRRTDEARSTPTNARPIDVPLKQVYLAQIKSGRKTVEGRVDNGMFKRMQEGSTVKFFNQTDSVICEIVKRTHYPSFKDMLEGEGVEACLPGCRSLQEGVRIYDGIPGYADKARQFGVVGLKLLLKR